MLYCLDNTFSHTEMDRLLIVLWYLAMVSTLIYFALVFLFTLWCAYFLFLRSSHSTRSNLKQRHNHPEDELDKAEKGTQPEQSTTMCDTCANQNIDTFSGAWFDALYFPSNTVRHRRSAATLWVARTILLCFNAYFTWLLWSRVMDILSRYCERPGITAPELVAMSTAAWFQFAMTIITAYSLLRQLIQEWWFCRTWYEYCRVIDTSYDRSSTAVLYLSSCILIYLSHTTAWSSR